MLLLNKSTVNQKHIILISQRFTSHYLTWDDKAAATAAPLAASTTSCENKAAQVQWVNMYNSIKTKVLLAAKI